MQRGRFDEAIAAWQPLAAEPAVARALAEAHFRRALGPDPADALADLRRAAALNPADARFPFHLGRLLHRAGESAAAAEQYRAALAIDPQQPAAARLLVLLTLEQNPRAELAALPGAGPEVLAWAAPAAAMLRGKAPPPDDSPLGRLWRGLDQLVADDPGAGELLDDQRPLPTSALNRLRDYYRGLAAARSGDSAGALARWQQLYTDGAYPPAMVEPLAALLHEQLLEAVSAGDRTAAGELALRWAALPGGSAFDELRVQALDAAAHEAATAGAWPQALARWDAARQILARNQSVGSPRPVLHNLALAYERLERWEEAASSWRALLRTRPRKTAGERDAQDEARWAWVRARIITCYRNAGRPDEAVVVFRQMLKLDPDDLDLRFQLADALLANEQERAAQNEIRRILQADPYHPQAVLREAAFLSARWQLDEAQRLVAAMAERHPERADVRRSVAALFLSNGRELADFGNYAAAYQCFVEGERYAPDEPRLLLNQARMLHALRRPDDTHGLIERALAAGGDANDAWLLAIETWVLADKLDAARTLLDRFVQERSPAPEELASLGMQLMSAALPPVVAGPFGIMAAPPRSDTPASALALDVLERAVRARPDDARLPLAIASFLMLPRPDLARSFAERALQIVPDDLDAQILLGVILGLDNQVDRAKHVLQQVGRAARAQGRADLHAQAQELRRLVGTPMLRLMLSSQLDDFDELDDLLP